MTPKSIAAPLLSLAISALLFALTFLMDARPPKELRFISGLIVDKQALHTRNRFSGFRLLVGDPALPFTYQDPDPDVDRVWSRIQTARAARIRFDLPPGGAPMLWELEADGHPVVTLKELEASRARWFWLCFWAAAIAAGIGLVSMRSWWRARRPPRRRARNPFRPR